MLTLAVIMVAIATIFNTLTLRNIASRRGWLLIGEPQSYIRITDRTSGAVTYWNPKRGCCDVRPHYIPAPELSAEAYKAQVFYHKEFGRVFTINRGIENEHGI